jgi:hypothetical protein
MDAKTIAEIVKSVTEVMALIIGPIAAVQAQRKVDEHKQGRERRLALFRTLMGTRVARGADPRHTEALNLVEIEFYECADVITAWRDYMNHLNRDPATDGWGLTGDNLFVDLLARMAKAAGYEKIDKSRIREAYSPQLFADLARDQLAIRKGVIRMLEGSAAIRVQPVGPGIEGDSAPPVGTPPTPLPPQGAPPKLPPEH